MRREFLSPPLLPGFLKSVYEAVGRGATPTPIQQLALKHVFPQLHVPDNNGELPEGANPIWRQFLLASETGSGKSLAYMLPLLQYLKRTERFPAPLPPDFPQENEFTSSMLAPRGLIMAPTHELSRQLTVFAKSLIHNEKLRVLCSSRANNSSSSRGRNSTASQMKREMEEMDLDLATGHGTGKHPVDLLIGTPMKILEMARGWGWNKADQIKEDWEPEKVAKALNWTLGKRQMSLRNVEYVVIDEADVQFGE
ncbi:MAG TPA: DEAD/DEAH box helicase [Chlamydiales bacterium]|jgi:ATP-dependent RNA helicase MRH4|nr:DEAD/DEAH box helicase [Chlamydiales bacterium]